MQDPRGGFPVFSAPVSAEQRKKDLFWGGGFGTYLHFPLSNAIILRLHHFLKSTMMEDIP
jgi:hypothetical protein